ncbi:MAG: hypothetical protein Q4G42_03225 [Neisseria sp.]|nr:hypothetical protein [Neisseria sp.]
MIFNRFVLDNYLVTGEGQRMLDIFEHFFEVIKDNRIDDFKWVVNKIRLKPIGEYINIDFDNLKNIFEDIDLEDLNQKNTSSDEAYDDFWGLINVWLSIQFPEVQEGDDFSNRQAKEILPLMTVISVDLFLRNPNFFFPYFYEDHFFQLENTFKYFNIEMPEEPPKNNYWDRLEFYWDLCLSLNDFKKKYNLTPAECCVLLYGFIPNMLPNFISQEKLPEPTHVYITGASPEDTKNMKHHPMDKFYWAGNPLTMRGDIVLIYSLTPHKAITAVSRTITASYFDPFSYYANRIWIGESLLIPHVSFSELKNNAVWKDKGLVKANMQGVGGRECSSAEYDALLAMLEAKGFDISGLPRLMRPEWVLSDTLKNERDVERYMLEPLLERLGFSDEDWVRQMSVRMGRGERNYPDYALLANTKKGQESARFIWEAKYSITNDKQLEDAFLQAKSYALRLSAVGLGLAAQEGFWVSWEADRFELKKIRFFPWSELADIDAFGRLLHLIGRDILVKKR